MEIPIQLTDDKDKIKFLYRAKIKMIEEHNSKGADFRAKKITEKEFREYQRGDWETRYKKLMHQINLLKEANDMTRNYNSDGANPSQNLRDMAQIKEDAKTFSQYDGEINLKQI